MTATTSAAQHVFDTYELLENILSKTPAKQLFVLQRVSKPWKALIERSVHLRQKMFLKTKCQIVQVPDGQDEHGNYLGAELPRYSKYLAINEFCKSEESDLPGWYTADSDSSQGQAERHGVCTIKNGKGRGYKTPEASWRHMQLSRPPCAIAYLDIAMSNSGKAISTYYGCSVRDKDGVTLGHLLEIGEKMISDAASKNKKFWFGFIASAENQ